MIRITLAYSPVARQVHEEVLGLPDGAIARDAALASNLIREFEDLHWQGMSPGIWGKVVEWDAPLKDLDRIELCRELQVDPKVARRERFKKQGVRGTGLFAKRLDGAKTGY